MASLRLGRDAVEMQIIEMWSALDGITPDVYQEAWSDTVRRERELRERLAAQDRLDNAAPKLLDALRRAVNHAEHGNDSDWIGAAYEAIRAATEGE